MKKAMFLILLSFLILGCSSQSKIDEKYANLVGKTYTYEVAQQLGGNPETLQGTNNQKWIAYFPKADITIIEDKKTGIIKKIVKGKGI